MAGSPYDQQPHLHPALKDVQKRYFSYSAGMYPKEFANFYSYCPIQLPSGWTEYVNITRYQSGFGNSFNQEKLTFIKHLRKFYGSSIPPGLNDWLSTTRPTAVFSGHGLPEEISLVCTQAIKSGYRSPSTIDSWAWTYIGLDCNGFVCFYLISLGTFSRVLHSHPSYPGVSRLAKSVSEISYDSVILWVKQINKDETTESKKRYKVKQNPTEDGAHIAVIDDWNLHGDSLRVTERGGSNRFQGHIGIHTGIYDIVEAPKAGCADDKAVWKVRSRAALHGKSKATSVEKVFITRRMESY